MSQGKNCQLPSALPTTGRGHFSSTAGWRLQHLNTADNNDDDLIIS